MFYVDKTYGHNLGLSACFRQPLASSHCKDPHGYPLSFRFRFGALMLCRNNWVIDFGSLKPIKEMLVENFDHRTILAENDPALNDFKDLYAKWNFAPPVVLPFVGCEGFAKFSYDWASLWLVTRHMDAVKSRGLFLAEVEVREHSANSASYTGG